MCGFKIYLSLPDFFLLLKVRLLAIQAKGGVPIAIGRPLLFYSFLIQYHFVIAVCFVL